MTRYTQPEIDWVEQKVADRLGVLLSSLRTALARRAAKEAKKGDAA